jgi:hypothetical protein
MEPELLLDDALVLLDALLLDDALEMDALALDELLVEEPVLAGAAPPALASSRRADLALKPSRARVAATGSRRQRADNCLRAPESRRRRGWGRMKARTAPRSRGASRSAQAALRGGGGPRPPEVWAYPAALPAPTGSSAGRLLSGGDNLCTTSGIVF